MFSFVGGPYTAGVTKISAATMNYLRGSYANALDIIDGGTWTPITQTVLAGTIGLKTNFSATGLQIAGLGGLHILSGSTGYVDSGGFFTVSAGGVATVANTAFLYIANGAEQIVQSGGQLTIAASGVLDMADNSSISMSGDFTFTPTAVVTYQAGNTITGPQNLDASGSIVLSPARTFVRSVPAIKWVIGTSTMDVVSLAVPTAGAAATPLAFVPHGATITSLSVQVDPAVNDGVAAATPCKLSLARRAVSGAGATITPEIGSFTSDASASDAEHTITHALSQVLDLTAYEYYVYLTGEDGANAQVMTWLATKVTYTLGTVPLG